MLRSRQWSMVLLIMNRAGVSIVGSVWQEWIQSPGFNGEPWIQCWTEKFCYDQLHTDHEIWDLNKMVENAIKVVNVKNILQFSDQSDQ
ncbi:hypothetical protein M8J77_019825 [Diaphorina citri]|nr:hypothetical protein M8J77_019825 [Diaphorina citri]